MSRRNEKVQRMMSWFKTLDDEQKNQVAYHLFEYALMAEWINISDEDEEPYVESCGESLLDQ